MLVLRDLWFPNSDGLSSDVLPNDCKLVGTSRLSDEEATEKRSLMSPSDKNVKHQNLTRYYIYFFFVI